LTGVQGQSPCPSEPPAGANIKTIGRRPHTTGGIRCCRGVVVELGGAEPGGLQTYLRPLAMGSPGTPGHDGIRAPGSQSMTAASRARVVIGFPGAGPTCSAVSATPPQFQAGFTSFRWRRPQHS